eukprot:scpid38872/ scgid28046/ 
MDSDDEQASSSASSAGTLEQFFKEPDTTLPSSVDVVEGFKGWKDQESLKTGSRVLLVGLQGNQSVQMTDDTGGDFEESLPFQRCKFLLLQADKPWLDNVVYHSADEVVRLPDGQRPEYLRTCRGFLFSAEEGLSTDEILYVTKDTVENEDGEKCAIWYRLASGDSGSTPIAQRKRTKVLIPLVDKLGSGVAFDTVVDPRKHHLQEIVDMTQAGKLSFPLRVKPVDIVQEEGKSPTTTLPIYSIIGLTDTQWLVGIELGEGTFFRIPVSMATRVQVQRSELRGSDLKLCMHAVLESLADTDLRVIGPQAEGSLSSVCATPSTPILPKRTPPEGMQQSGFGAKLEVPGAKRTTAGANRTQEKHQSSETATPGDSGTQGETAGKQSRQVMPGSSHSMEGMYRSRSAVGNVGGVGGRGGSTQLRSTASLRRFSTPAVRVNVADTLARDSLAEESPTGAGKDAKASKKTGPAAWGIAAVIKELDDLSLSQYGAQFQREGVTGELFLQLDDEMLRDDFGISNRFHRMKLINFISKCRK